MKHALPGFLVLLLAACGPDSMAEVGDDQLDTSGSELRLRSQNRLETVDVVSWNVEWFGSAEEGPPDERVQQANVRSVLRQLDADLVGLVEVVDADAFTRLVEALPDYEGLLVTDPRVTGGAQSYWVKEQKVALLFKKRFTVASARVVVTEASSDFAGRPPMEVKLSFMEDGAPRTLVVVVAHFKAMANYDGWTRRTRASAAYKTWLDATYPSRWVLTIGDLNDDIDVSTYQRRESPFSNFTTDARNYRFTTDALTQAGLSTTATFSSTIDHHLATNELAARFVAGSALVVRPDQVIPNYATNTSDHFPVLTRYDVR